MSGANVVSRRVGLVWLILVAATLVSWLVGHGVGLSDRRSAGMVIIGVALLKVRLVMLDFMELRNAPMPLRIAVEAWTVVMLAVLVLLYCNP